jgi:hypothetical protein
MLLKSSITGIKIHSDEWFTNRLGKFTSSEIYNLMSDKHPSEGAISYVYRKVGEELTGQPSKDDIDTPAIRHGNLYEPEALKLFSEKMGIEYIVTQVLISTVSSRFSGTPDGLIVTGQTNEAYNVNTVEVKCPSSYENYIRLFKCKTPEQLLATNKQYFWQVIDQMYLCDCLKGYFVVYQPFFKAGNINVIEFRKMNLLSFFNTLKDRKEYAEKLFLKTRDELLQA